MDTADTQKEYITTAHVFVCQMWHHRRYHPATAQAVTQYDMLVAAYELSQEPDPENPDNAGANDTYPANM